MSVSVFSAARYLCEQSDWTLSNLKLQKILYLAHMIHLGEHDGPLVREGFEAWNYGPVSPDLYRQVKAFGSEPVRNVFHGYASPPEGSAVAAMDEVYAQVGNWTAGQLVRVTHRKDGAWDRTYIPGLLGIPIPNEFILQEYKNLEAQQKNARA